MEGKENKAGKQSSVTVCVKKPDRRTEADGKFKVGKTVFTIFYKTFQLKINVIQSNIRFQSGT
jgi:hypothetical protein